MAHAGDPIMSAEIKLWRRLADLLPPETLSQLRKEMREWRAADRVKAEQNKRWARVGRLQHKADPTHRDLRKLAQDRAWLTKHCGITWDSEG
jgi:uncharacterized coiled-coil DUF342 family protein